jgi:hypothetical protein
LDPYRSKTGQFATAAQSSVHKLAPEQFMPEGEYNNRLHADYFQGGEKVASSRTTAASPTSDLPTGMWRIGTYKGMYGRDIEQLREVPVDQLTPSEETKYEGRMGDVETYGGWLKAGKQAPPIEAVETDKGGIKITNGHRRWHAARQAGQKTIRAWVSPTADVPGSFDSEGKPLKTGLTRELATFWAADRGEKVSPEQRERMDDVSDERLAQLKNTGKIDPFPRSREEMEAEWKRKSEARILGHHGHKSKGGV